MSIPQQLHTRKVRHYEVCTSQIESVSHIASDQPRYIKISCCAHLLDIHFHVIYHLPSLKIIVEVHLRMLRSIECQDANTGFLLLNSNPPAQSCNNMNSYQPIPEYIRDVYRLIDRSLIL